MKMSVRKVESRIAELWKRLLGYHPTCFELGNILKNIPSLREAAAKELLAQENIPNEDLLCVMRYCDKMRIAAWDTFVLRNPSEVHLRYVVENVPPLAEVAGRMLLGRFPTKNFLFCIIERISLLRDEAWDQYCEQTPTNEELCSVVCSIPALQVEAGEILLRRKPSNADLQCIVVRVKNLAVEAGRILLRQDPSKDDIECVFHHVPDLKREAARMLVGRASDVEFEKLVVTYGSIISESAGGEFKRKTRKLSIADKEYIKSHAPLLKMEIERRQGEHSKARILDELLALGYKKMQNGEP